MAKKQYGTRKKYHFIYKTTNILSGKYYIGMHSTDDLNDGYLGSGTLLRRSVNKHGKENHSIEILEFLNSREELVAREVEIVSLQEIAKKECMNLKVGGQGGFSSEEHRKKFLEGRVWGMVLGGIRAQELLKNNPEKRKQAAKKRSITLKKYFENTPGHFAGKVHIPETIEKMKQSHKGAGKGETNSQYGTYWITNEIKNKKINKTDPIPEGWRLGRKLKIE